MEQIIFAAAMILGIQLVGYLLAFSLKTDKFTDLFYGMTFCVVALSAFFRAGIFDMTRILLVMMIAIWGTRLAFYLFIRIKRMKKDTRFDSMRSDPVKFGGFWLLQALSIFVIILPVLNYLYSSYLGLGFFTILGFVIWAAGFTIEAAADQQKFVFKKKNPHTWIQSGLWRYSRHPNYFGEILCWIGIFLYSVPGLIGWAWLSVFSPIFITVLLIYVSGIPLLEKQYDEKYGKNEDYKEYKERTSILIPMPPKPI